MPIRLNKLLVDRGVCSRREADRWITGGRVTVDEIAAILGQKVEGTEKILVNGRPIPQPQRKKAYLAYHKPVGMICTSDVRARDNIIAAVKYPERLFHVGRLDVASSGLILLTNDGEIVNRILRAQGKHEKEYVVTVDRPITGDFLADMATGVLMDGDDRPTLPAQIRQDSPNTFTVVLVEGRNRQIRRMCTALGYSVRSLRRVRIMHILLGDLGVGKWRHLTPKEEKELLTAL